MNGEKHTEAERALAEAKANEIYSSQLMRRFHETLSNIRAGMEDEGDRIYFGSTNDADALREIVDEVEELEWDRIFASSRKKPDLWGCIRKLNTEKRALINGCNALLGLIQLVTSRDDMPPEIRQALETSHRLEEARAALLKSGSRP